MWKLGTSERLSRWRDFRKQLNTKPFEQALNSLVECWQTCPFAPYYLDPDCPESWPDPWTLIEENNYCDLAKCLGIIYTIVLTAHRNKFEVELRIYEDNKTGHRYNLAWINQGKYIINLIDNTVVNKEQFDKTLVIIKKYSQQDLKLEQY